MRIPRLYTGTDHQSHFDQITLPFETQDAMGQITRWVSTQGCFIRESPATLDSGWHNASRRQFILILSGGIEIEVKDGEKRAFRTGEMLLVEDTTGEGHRTRALDTQPVRCLFVPLGTEEGL